MMKKTFLTLIIALCTVVLAGAQDLGQVTELYNGAATLLNEGNKVEALAQFEQTLASAEALGDEGAEIASKCKATIPSLSLSIAKGYANEQNIDMALTTLEKTVSLAEKCGDEGVAAEASGLIKTLGNNQKLATANNLFNQKDFAGAIEAYNAVIEADPENGTAYFRLGVAKLRTGDLDGSIETLTLAADKLADNAVQLKAVNDQLYKAYLTKANNCYKAKDMKGTLENAQKSVEVADNANAQKLIGHSASALKQYKIAADGYEAYLALNPEAKDKVQIYYQVGSAYQNLGDKDKACGYFKEIAQDPKWGEGARYQMTVLKCN